MAIVGLDLSGPPWRSSVANVEGDSLQYAERTSLDSVPREFHAQLDERLCVHAYPEKTRFVPGREAPELDGLIDSCCRHLTPPKLAVRPDTHVGLALPYDAGPLVRAGVPRCLRVQYQHLCAIETPLALCLDIVAHNAVQTPTRLLVVSRNGEAFELTAVQATSDSRRLTLDVTAHVLLPSGTDAVSDGQRRLVAELCSKATGPVSAHADGEAAERLWRELSRNVTDAPAVVPLPETAAADGAARMAAFLRDGRLHGAPCTDIAIRRVCPWHVGILTRIDRATFWRRLFVAGSVFETESFVRLTGYEPHLSVALTYCRANLPAVPLWIPQREFPKHAMRLLALRHLPQPTPPGADQVQELRVKLRSTLPGHLWDDSSVDLAVELVARA